MNGIEQHVDWVAAAAPKGEQVGPGLSRPKAATPAQVIQRTSTHTQRGPVGPERSVLDKLLGESSLAAHDERGSDPYNATGRQFRR